MSYGGPSSENPEAMPIKMANVLSVEPAHPLIAFLTVLALAHVCPQMGSLVTAGHACY